MSSDEHGDPLLGEQARLAWSSFMASRFQPQRRVRVSELDHELELLQEFSALVKMQRNAHVSMCKLPVELLIYIFDLLRAVWGPDWEREVYSEEDDSESESVNSSAGDISYDLGWMVVTHVCTVWRKVALSAPSLWCNINCSGLSTKMRKTVLQRSAQLPLSLAFDFEDRPSRRKPGTWVKEWLRRSTRNRLRYLELTCVPDSPEKLSRILRRLRELPQLVSLVIQREDLAESMDEPMTIHWPFATYPHLTRLSFRDCFPPLSSPIFSSDLTHLTLETHYDEIHESVPTVEDIVVMLSALTHIEELRLDSVPVLRPDDSMPPAALSSSIPCTLPSCFRLFDYTVNDWNQSIGAALVFVPRLRFPHGAKINMRLDHSMHAECDRDATFAHLTDLIHRAVDGTRNCPWKLDIDGDSLCTEFGDNSLSNIDPTQDLHEHAADHNCTHIDIWRGAGDRADMPRVLDLLPLVNLTYLSLSSWVLKVFLPVHGTPPVSLFAMHAIRHIVLSPSTETSFFGALAETRATGAMATALLFPRLEVLALRWNPAMSLTGANLAPFTKLLPELNIAIAARQQCTTPVREVQVDRRYEALHAWEVTEGTRVVFFEHNSRNYGSK